MIRFGIVFTLAVGTVAAPMPALAWGSIGHRVVGQVADKSLTRKAFAATSRIMGSSSLGDVANWMDEVRGTPEGEVMKPWHYQSVDLCHPSPAACAHDNCAGRRIEMAIETLKHEAGRTRPSRARRLKALRVLVHLVGDVHQPLHTAENGDIGGNSVIIQNRTCIDFNTGEPVHCKLHSYWDNNLVKAAQGNSSERKFVSELAALSVSADGDPASWIVESNALAKEKVHTYQGFACKIGKNTVSLTPEYDDAAVPVVREQLAKAGKRLAAVLNDVYR